MSQAHTPCPIFFATLKLFIFHSFHYVVVIVIFFFFFLATKEIFLAAIDGCSHLTKVDFSYDDAAAAGAVGFV